MLSLLLNQALETEAAGEAGTEHPERQDSSITVHSASRSVGLPTCHLQRSLKEGRIPRLWEKPVSELDCESTVNPSPTQEIVFR